MMADGLNFGILDPSVIRQRPNALAGLNDAANNYANMLAKKQQMDQAKQEYAFNQLKMQDYQKTRADEDAQNAIYAGAINADTGAIDYNKLNAGMASGGFGTKIPAINKQRIEQQNAQIDQATKTHALVKITSSNVISNPTLANALAQLDYVQKISGVDMSQDKAQVTALGDDPTKIKAWGMAHSLDADKLLAKPTERATNTFKELTDTNPASSTYGQVIPGSRVEMGVSPNTTATINATAEQGRLNRAAKLKSELDSGVTDLSPESLDFTAQLYMQTGSLPPLGMGAKAASLRKQIIDRAATLSMHPDTMTAVNPSTKSGVNPSATPVSAADAAAGVSQNKQNVATQVKTLKDFSTGVQGQMTTSFNTALNHLDTMERLGAELASGDIKRVNKVATIFAKELGTAAPTNFDAAKHIVGAEIQKAIVRAGGTGAEREEAAAAFNNANSPAQLKGVIKTYKELLGGQLLSLKQQYDSNVGSKAKSFESKLNPAARKQLNALSGNTSANTEDPLGLR